MGLFLGGSAALAILVAKPYLERTGEEKGEFYALLLWGHLGVSLMIRGLDLLIVFIGLEILSLSLLRPRRVLPHASRRRRRRA